MQRDNSLSRLQDHLIVISLERTPHRLNNFFCRNLNALKHWKVHAINGVDGSKHKEVFSNSRLVSNNVLKGWSLGAIGSALSHLLSWRFCIELGEPVIIAEDDAIIAPKLKQELDKLLQNKNDLPSFLLLGWNLDSLLQAELEPGLGLISLFEPAYPSEIELTHLVNSTTKRKMCKLKRCFGLPAYRITPEAASYLLKELNPLESEVIEMGRGIPTHFSETLDGLLNNQYERMGAGIVFPPLALAINNQSESLTRKNNPKNFEE